MIRGSAFLAVFLIGFGLVLVVAAVRGKVGNMSFIKPAASAPGTGRSA